MRPEKRADHVSSRINKMLFGHMRLTGMGLTDSESCIFKVHQSLRKVNEACYDPMFVAIGPYHRGKDSLQFMEKQKLCYLQQLLKRRNEDSVERYIVALRELEERAYTCYAESLSLSSDEFVEMMLLDGCFIIELFRKAAMAELRDEHDPIFKFSSKYVTLLHDLILFENQLPFFVISELFNMTEVHQLDLTHIASITLSSVVLPQWHIRYFNRNSMQNVPHLLGLIHNNLLPSSVENEAAEGKWPIMRCTMELHEASVKFKNIEESSLFNIKFNNGLMEIPTLSIFASTESLFRNLIAYEQQYCVDTYLTEYVVFMDRLINSPKDVEFLSRQRIIDNWLGDDAKVSTMFNTLAENVILDNFRYSTICNNVNMHCSKCWNVQKAYLRDNYFNSPWALISFIAATLLLLLTAVQTIFSIIH